VERATLLRSLRELPEFKEFFDEEFLGRELDQIGQSILDCIATGNEDNEQVNRKAYILRKSFKDYLDSVEDEGASAVQYLTEYKLSQTLEEEESADQ